MHAAEGILTTRGGMTSHAAVVARGMGKPCVSGCGSIRIDYGRGTMSLGSRTFKTGDIITIDGSTGQVLAGRVPMIEPEMSGEFGYADEAGPIRDPQDRACASMQILLEDARAAIQVAGAEGIGLCRTEHMFFEETRIRTVREMILSEDEQSRRAALSKLLPMQRADFVELFEIMKGLPVTIRLLDPPLHEFLPHTQAEIEEVARAMNTDPRRLADRAREAGRVQRSDARLPCRLPSCDRLSGNRRDAVACDLRGRCRSAEAHRQSRRARGDGAADRDQGRVRPGQGADRRHLRSSVMKETGTKLGLSGRHHDRELPRACLMAGEIAETAEFFSFGTNRFDANHLRGISRDDAASFTRPLRDQVASSRSIRSSRSNREGVGELVKIGVERGRKTRPNLKVGICGEHGGDPASVAFCHDIGLDYVSCSPYRVPIARLAAAQAAIGKVVASQA